MSTRILHAPQLRHLPATHTQLTVSSLNSVLLQSISSSSLGVRIAGYSSPRTIWNSPLAHCLQVGFASRLIGHALLSPGSAAMSPFAWRLEHCASIASSHSPSTESALGRRQTNRRVRSS